MGFTGTFLLTAVADVDVVDWLEDVDVFEDADNLTVSGQAWLTMRYGDLDVFWQRDEVLTRLVAQTGRPVLVAMSMDSDFLGVVGLTLSGVSWSGVVDAEAAADHREIGLAEDYEDEIPVFGDPDAAVDGAMAWATEAGLVAHADQVRHIFAVKEWEQPADAYWFDLLAALGFRDGSGN